MTTPTPSPKEEHGRSGGAEVPDFGPDNKAHLSQQFDFPKREFGKTKVVRRAFQAQAQSQRQAE